MRVLLQSNLGSGNGELFVVHDIALYLLITENREIQGQKENHTVL